MSISHRISTPFGILECYFQVSFTSIQHQQWQTIHWLWHSNVGHKCILNLYLGTSHYKFVKAMSLGTEAALYILITETSPCQTDITIPALGLVRYSGKNLWISIVISVNFYRELVHLIFILRNLMFIFSAILEQLYHINLRRLPS